MKKFMANTYGKWNATDNLENVKWPMRRYIYGVKKGAKWIITYEHEVLAIIITSSFWITMVVR